MISALHPFYPSTRSELLRLLECQYAYGMHDIGVGMDERFCARILKVKVYVRTFCLVVAACL